MAYELKSSDQTLLIVAEKVLDEAKLCYEEHKKFTPKVLEKLTVIYGDVLIDAFNIVDKRMFTEYNTNKKDSRTIYFLIMGAQRFVFTEGVNLCSCNFFKENVLKLQCLACPHVLALKLSKIVGKIRKEVITNKQLTTILDGQVEEMFPKNLV